MRNKVITPLLSLLIPGLGQAIEGEAQRGIFILFLTLIIDYALIFLLQWLILVPFWHAFVIYDAYKVASRKSEEEEYEAEEETEEESYVKLDMME